MRPRTANSVLQRIASVGLAIGGVVMAAGSWAELAEPSGVGGLLTAAAGAVLGIYGHRPRHTPGAHRFADTYVPHADPDARPSPPRGGTGTTPQSRP